MVNAGDAFAATANGVDTNQQTRHVGWKRASRTTILYTSPVFWKCFGGASSAAYGGKKSLLLSQCQLAILTVVLQLWFSGCPCSSTTVLCLLEFCCIHNSHSVSVRAFKNLREQVFRHALRVQSALRVGTQDQWGLQVLRSDVARLHSKMYWCQKCRVPWFSCCTISNKPVTRESPALTPIPPVLNSFPHGELQPPPLF